MRPSSYCIATHWHYISAPFDGFIEEVPVRAGDAIKKDQALLNMDRSDLLLEESGAIADLGRYSREADKARAANSLADMRIAQALANQAAAKLELVRYRLAQASLKAPFEGVVAEGDQKERLGAPVKQGEILFKVSRTDALYVEAEVHERDIHELKTGGTGEIAFISQPKMKFPIKVTLIHAAAIPKDAENVFLVRCAIDGPVQSWWRPRHDWCVQNQRRQEAVELDFDTSNDGLSALAVLVVIYGRSSSNIQRIVVSDCGSADIPEARCQSHTAAIPRRAMARAAKSF